MPTQITSAGITFNDTTSLTSALIPTTSLTGTIAGSQIANGAVTAAKLGTNEQKQIAKAWVNFNGTTSPGTIRSSYNVSSVTKNATGRWTVNFSTPMANANYSAVASGSRDASGSQVGVFVTNFLSGSFDINEVAGATFFDIPTVTAAVFAE